MKPRLWTKRTNVFRQWVCILIVYAACVFKIREMSLGFQSLSSVDVFAFLYAYSDVCWLLISILLFLNAISLLFFLRRYSLTGIRNYHPMFLYLLLSFVFPCTITLWGMLTILVTINGLFPQLFDMDEKNIYVKTFIYGLWCGLLSLLYTPFLLLLIFIYIVFLTEKFYKFRAFILPVAGSCLAYIYLFTGLYLFDQTDMLHIFIENIKASVADFGISLSLSGERNMYYVGIAILMGVIAFLKVLSKSSSVVIYRRKKQYVLLWMILLQSVITICFHAPYFLFAQILLLLLTIMLSLYLLYVKRRTIYYLMALLLFISALYSNFL